MADGSGMAEVGQKTLTMVVHTLVDTKYISHLQKSLKWLMENL